MGKNQGKPIWWPRVGWKMINLIKEQNNVTEREAKLKLIEAAAFGIQSDRVTRLRSPNVPGLDDIMKEIKKGGRR